MRKRFRDIFAIVIFIFVVMPVGARVRGEVKKKTAAGCCGWWFCGNFIERKTGFELALISHPSVSKSARVGPAPFYILPGPPQEGGEGLGANPVFRSGAGGSIKKKTVAGVLRSVVLWELY